MPTLLELTAEIVTAHASNTQMTSDEMVNEIQKVYGTLKTLEQTGPQTDQQTGPERPKQLSIKQAFKKDEIVCMICGKSFTTLKRHLAVAHDLKPGLYRKQFNIPSSLPLAAKSYSESRRQAAHERGLVDVLAKAREKRASGKKPVVPVEKSKAPVPVLKPKAQAPVVKKKAAVPAKAAVKQPRSQKKASE